MYFAAKLPAGRHHAHISISTMLMWPTPWPRGRFAAFYMVIRRLAGTVFAHRIADTISNERVGPATTSIEVGSGLTEGPVVIVPICLLFINVVHPARR
jgi:hypothetical protein